MTTKKCSRCDREVFSTNDTECDYCLGKIVLAGDDRKLFKKEDIPVKDSQPREDSKGYSKEDFFVKGSQSAGKVESSPADRLTQQIGQMIEAQNRTTAAVRALVKFIFLQMLTLTLGGLFWAMGLSTEDSYQCANFGKNCSGSVFFLVLCAITVIGGTSLSFREGWKELKASEIR